MTRVIDRLELFDADREPVWMVASNGAVLWRYAPLKVAHRYTFDAGPAVRAFLQRCPAAIVAVELDGVGYRLTAPFPEGELPGETTVADLAQLLAEPASRVIVRDPASAPEDFARFAAEIKMPGADYAVGWSAWLDLTPAGITKVAGLQHVCAQLGVAASDVLALGDGLNDIAMLRWAGLACAVANAHPAVLAAADRVLPANDDDGVAVLLEEAARAVAGLGSSR